MEDARIEMMRALKGHRFQLLSDSQCQNRKAAQAFTPVELRLRNQTRNGLAM